MDHEAAMAGMRGSLAANARQPVALRYVTRSVALLLLAGTTFGVAPALADGGAGGATSILHNSGAGGSDSAAGAGGTGGNGIQAAGFGGGGGGGSGLTGGRGGDGIGPGAPNGVGGAGGDGGQAPGAQGADGANGQGVQATGGGGGGGAHGFVGVTLPGGPLTGGNGGKGGDGFPTTITGGGGGGAGGFGAVVTGDPGVLGGAVTGGAGGAGGDGGYVGGNGGSGGTGLLLSNPGATTIIIDRAVTGGAGGDGGDSAGFGGGGGRGGSGGTGLLLSNPGAATIVIQNAVTGGNGGAGGDGFAIAGSGGAGLVGSNLTVTNSGTISGGLGGDGVTRADAIVFTGGNNVLTFTNPTSGLTGAISVTGSLTFDQSTTSTLDQAITGGGSVTKAGTATLVLSGASTYTGATTVSAGTLQIASTGSITSDTDVASGASLVNEGMAQNVTNAGTSSNAGTLASLDNTGGTFDNKAGGIVTGTVGISGGAVTNEGAVQGLSTISGGSLGNSGILAGVANQAGGTFNNLTGGTAGAVTNAGTGSNAGTIASLDNTGGTFDNKMGGTVSGLTSVTGGTVNNEGTLAGNAEIGGAGTLVLKNGSVTGSVSDSGLLRGVGTVGATTVKSGGTVAPGANGVGTLAVNGSFTQDAGSTYQALLDPSSNASNAIAVTGAADIAGATLNVTKTAPGTPWQLGTEYTVLTANGGVTGTYDLTGDLALSHFVGLTDVYDSGHVYLKVAQTTLFTSLGGTFNQTSTAAGLQSLPEDSPLLSALVLGLPSDAAARAAFDQLSGEIHPSIAGQMIEDSRFVRDAALDRLTDAFCGVGHGGDPERPDASGVTSSGACSVNPDRVTAWGHAFGSWGQFGSDGNAASMSRTIGGFIAGIDAPVGDDWRTGILAGYSQSNFSVNGRGSSGTSDDYTVGLYGGRQWDALSLKLGAAYTWHDIDTDRTPVVPGLASSRLSASYHAGTAQAFGELGYRFRINGLDLEPFANLAYVNQQVGGFGEEGGDAALRARSQDQNVGFSTLGLHAATSFILGPIPVTAKATLGWQHAFGDVEPSTTFTFAEGSPFTTRGLPIAWDAAVVDAGLDFQFMPGTTLGVSYGGQFGKKATDQSAHGTLSVRF